MAEAGRDPTLSQEALERVGRQALAGDFQRYLFLPAAGEGAIHDRARARAEAPEDLELAKLLHLRSIGCPAFLGDTRRAVAAPRGQG
jgi:hypothetical protein